MISNRNTPTCARGAGSSAVSLAALSRHPQCRFSGSNGVLHQIRGRRLTKRSSETRLHSTRSRHSRGSSRNGPVLRVK
ncbi:hypothetical protein [Methylobacter sp.]|uniref:hypothetical protein n=1 Tax=Methylobacter sp. TaxID=2051955 RepID=UPI002FDD87EB